MKTFVVVDPVQNCFVPDEDLRGWNVEPLQLLHMFATWMLKIATDYK